MSAKAGSSRAPLSGHGRRNASHVLVGDEGGRLPGGRDAADGGGVLSDSSDSEGAVSDSSGLTLSSLMVTRRSGLLKLF